MKQLRNRRGVALESALLFLIVLFSLCSLLTTVAVVGRYQVKIENTALYNRVALDQVGEDFVRGKITENGSKTVDIDGRTLTLYYTVDILDSSNRKSRLKVWYGTSSDGDAVLTVETVETTVDPTNPKTMILSWVYG